jgi:hypothetical protein
MWDGNCRCITVKVYNSFVVCTRLLRAEYSKRNKTEAECRNDFPGACCSWLLAPLLQAAEYNTSSFVYGYNM